MGYQCFSQRLLNPFRGTTTTLRYQSAVAAGLGYRQEHEGAVADYLARVVNSLTADKSSAQLFERRPGGRSIAQAGVRISPGLENRVLPDDTFPGLMPGRWNHDSAHNRLIDDFFRCQAPWLLLLSNLDPGQRRAHEQDAHTQPHKAARHYPLYPEIIDRQTIDAARVEADLRETMPGKPAEKTSLSTFYIELCPEVAD